LCFGDRVAILKYETGGSKFFYPHNESPRHCGYFFFFEKLALWLLGLCLCTLFLSGQAIRQLEPGPEMANGPKDAAVGLLHI
jgi:hypothetical protein